jgi:hypothetical protein
MTTSHGRAHMTSPPPASIAGVDHDHPNIHMNTHADTSGFWCYNNSSVFLALYIVLNRKFYTRLRHDLQQLRHPTTLEHIERCGHYVVRTTRQKKRGNKGEPLNIGMMHLALQRSSLFNLTRTALILLFLKNCTALKAAYLIN